MKTLFIQFIVALVVLADAVYTKRMPDSASNLTQRETRDLIRTPEHHFTIDSNGCNMQDHFCRMPRERDKMYRNIVVNLP